MNLEIDLQVEVSLSQEEAAELSWIEKALQAAVESELQTEKTIEVSIRIVDDSTIQELNHTYRQLDRATDVLSFPQWEPDDPFAELEEVLLLGDIVISYPIAKKQAAQLGHSLTRELGFLSVHGFLHLIGFDHHTPEESRVMFAKQEEILQRIGLSR